MNLVFQEALRELKQLIDYLNVLNALFPLVLDLSLARGLDYYTGKDLIVMFFAASGLRKKSRFSPSIVCRRDL